MNQPGNDLEFKISDPKSGRCNGVSSQGGASVLEKKKSGGEKEAKPLWVRHQDFPGGHPSQYYSGPWALSCGVLMGSGVVAQV